MSSSVSEAPTHDGEPLAPQRSSLLRSSAIMASGTLISRILGFIRNAMLLAAIGSVGGGVMAAFQTANTLPNMVFNILAAGVLDAVLVPQIVRALKKNDGQVFVNRLLTAAGLILFILTVVAMIAAPLLIMITAASYSAEIRALSIAFALVCLPQIFFYGVYNLLGEVLNARGVFGPYMWAPVVNNIVGIGGLAVFLYIWGSHPTILPISDFTSPQFWVLAGSATLGVVCQALVLIIPLRRAHIRLRPDFHFRGTSFGSIPRVVGWTFGILAISQVGIFSTTNLVAMADEWAHKYQPNLAAVTDASHVVVGNAAYATAFMIFMVPQSLIAVSLATALFTRISHAAANNDHEEVARQFHISVRAISTLNLLAAAILTAGSIPMMRLVNYRADAAIVEAYAWVLMAMLPGVASIGLVLMSQRIFFAYEDAKPAFIAGIVPNFVQVFVGWTLYALTGPAWWVVGASFAEAACRTSQGFISLRLAHQVNHHIQSRQLIVSFMRSAVAAVGAAIAGFGVMALLGWHAQATSSVGRMLISILHLTLVAIVATIVFWLILRLISPEETLEVGSIIVARFPMPTFLRYFFVGGGSTAHVTSSDTRLESPDGDLAAATSEDPMSDHSLDDTPVDDPDATPLRGTSLPPIPTAGTSSPVTPAGSGSDDDEASAAHQGDSPDLGWGASHAPDSEGEEDDNDTEGARSAAGASSLVARPKAVASQAIASMGPAVSAMMTRLREGLAQAQDKLRSAEESSLNAQGLPPLPDEEPQDASDKTVTRRSYKVLLSDADTPAAPPHPAPEQPVHHFSRAAVIFFLVFTLGASVWALRTATSPIDWSAPSIVVDGLESDSPGDQATQSAAPTPQEAPAPSAPKISSVQVLSWRDDQGDNENHAINMIDGNAETEWHSRQFDGPFGPDTGIAIVVKLDKPARVSEVVLTMHESTQGGELHLTRNADKPREGEVLVTSAMSPQTTLTLPEAQEMDSFVLRFGSVPQAVDGAQWAWIYDIAVH